MFKAAQLLFLVTFSFSVASPCGSSPPESSKVVHEALSKRDDIRRVIVVVMENTYRDVAMKQPFMNSLLKRGAFLANYKGITHPSQPNYLALIGGETFDVAHDEIVNVNARHLGNLVQEKGLSWRAYAEDYPGKPGNCFLGAYSGLYMRKHVPFLNFINVSSDRSQCDNVVEAVRFHADRISNALPSFSFYVPNMNNDGHDTTPEFADNWLSREFGPLLRDDAFMKNTLVVITFDEDDWHHGNDIYTVLLGAGVKPGAVSNRSYNHYSLLRTIQEIYKLDSLGKGDATASIISDIWQ